METPLVLCILDTPTADADKTNLLTAGKSGELFEKMIKAIDLFLTQNCFVLPSIPWRPPGNRQPTPDEINLCLPFLKKQIQLINPKSILLMGSLSPQILLQNSLPKSRQQQFNLTIQQNTYPCFATFSSTMVLEQSSLREKAWEDLKKFRSFLQTLS